MIRRFEQIERLDYTKTFVSMIKSMNYKTMYVIIVVNDWKIEQMNVKTTFLYDKIHENVFVVQFTKFEQEINKICKLNKALYDLKQFSRVWFETLIKYFFFLIIFHWTSNLIFSWKTTSWSLFMWTIWFLRNSISQQFFDWRMSWTNVSRWAI
jgi:hypothetical protein